MTTCTPMIDEAQCPRQAPSKLELGSGDRLPVVDLLRPCSPVSSVVSNDILPDDVSILSNATEETAEETEEDLADSGLTDSEGSAGSRDSGGSIGSCPDTQGEVDVSKDDDDDDDAGAMKLRSVDLRVMEAEALCATMRTPRRDESQMTRVQNRTTGSLLLIRRGPDLSPRAAPGPSPRPAARAKVPAVPIPLVRTCVAPPKTTASQPGQKKTVRFAQFSSTLSPAGIERQVPMQFPTREDATGVKRLRFTGTGPRSKPQRSSTSCSGLASPRMCAATFSGRLRHDRYDATTAMMPPGCGVHHRKSTPRYTPPGNIPVWAGENDVDDSSASASEHTVSDAASGTASPADSEGSTGGGGVWGFAFQTLGLWHPPCNKLAAKKVSG
mmetsp:Transcript_56896/g.101534  ORF Transcript_56896/g.101534 Transcript_56896/m.101534 type:complete len:384 (-) Transcript_56896:595-1746(-)